MPEHLQLVRSRKRPASQVVFASVLAVLLAAEVFAAEPARAEARPFLWEVRSTQATAYLLGSIHAAKRDIYPLHHRIERAFADSNILVVEVDLTEQAIHLPAEEVLNRALYPDGDDLTRHIPESLFELARERMAKHGFTVHQVRQLKPWYVAATLTLLELRTLGILPEHGMDLHYIKRARGNKRIVALEDEEAYIDLLDGLSDRQQLLYLKHTLNTLDNLAAHMDQVFNAWGTGDVRRLEQLLQQSSKDSPEMRFFYAKTIDARNKVMARKINRLLQTKNTYFIIVGAGHLIGEKGLLKILSKHHTVQQL